VLGIYQITNQNGKLLLTGWRYHAGQSATDI